MNIFIIGLCLATVLGSTVATDYCASSLCNSGVKHIACDNNEKFASTCPTDAAIVKIDSSVKTAIVDAHNSKRNLVAGGTVTNLEPACRMATMQWDAELESLAALDVHQCAMSHDQCRNTDAFRHSGQNSAWVSFTGTPSNAAPFQRAIQMWYDEVENSKMAYIDSYPSNYEGPTIGHFTVMMADRNIKVGCAAANLHNTYLVACNYATTNMKNFPIYASCSKAGTSCTTGKNSQYPNLCSTAEVYDVNKWY